MSATTWKLIAEEKPVFPCVIGRYDLDGRWHQFLTYAISGHWKEVWTHWTEIPPQPEPVKSACEKAWEDNCMREPQQRCVLKWTCWQSAWSAATERAAFLVETCNCPGSGGFRAVLADRIRKG